MHVYYVGFSVQPLSMAKLAKLDKSKAQWLAMKST